MLSPYFPGCSVLVRTLFGGSGMKTETNLGCPRKDGGLELQGFCFSNQCGVPESIRIHIPYGVDSKHLNWLERIKQTSVKRVLKRYTKKLDSGDMVTWWCGEKHAPKQWPCSKWIVQNEWMMHFEANSRLRLLWTEVCVFWVLNQSRPAFDVAPVDLGISTKILIE